MAQQRVAFALLVLFEFGAVKYQPQAPAQAEPLPKQSIPVVPQRAADATGRI